MRTISLGQEAVGGGRRKGQHFFGAFVMQTRVAHMQSVHSDTHIPLSVIQRSTRTVAEWHNDYQRQDSGIPIR